MATFREWLARVWGTFRRSPRDRDLEEELKLHIDLAREAQQRHGDAPSAAAREVRRQQGGVAQTMEALRDQRGLPWVSDLGRDVRYSCRMLAKNPGFTIVAVLSLAIGIGANAAVFSLAETLLLRPVIIPDAGRMLTVGASTAFGGSLSGDYLGASYREYVDLTRANTSFEHLIASTEVTAGFSVSADTVPGIAFGDLVTSNFFRVIGLQPVIGRDFRPDEDQVPGRDAVVILGHAFWQEGFAADPAVVGRTVRINGVDFTVIGVAPEGFTGLAQYSAFDFYVPLMMWRRVKAEGNINPFEARDVRRLTVHGRLRPGATLARANAELAGISANLARAYPDINRDVRFVARTELQRRLANAPPLVVILGTLGLLSGAVLLVACANVSGLLASRAPVRAREIALRMAIGAGRFRVVRQLITESLLIAAAGGVAGLGVSYVAVRFFRRIRIPTDLPIAFDFELDGRTLLVSLVVATVSAVLFGLAPALRSARIGLTTAMKTAETSGGRRLRGRGLLVGGQVAVAAVLLVIAMYVYRDAQYMLAGGPGFRTDDLVMMTIDPRLVGYDESRAGQLFTRLAEQARHMPGVVSATLTRYMPMDGTPPTVSVVPEGFVFPKGKESATHGSSIIDEHYFETIGIPLLRGRGFRSTDTSSAPRVAVVNEVFGGRYWPSQDPLGKRFRLGDSWVEIVGVARTSKYVVPIEQPAEFIYLPLTQRPAPVMWLLVRSQNDPARLVPALREMVGQIDANLPIWNVRTMEQHYQLRALNYHDLVITLLAALGLMGLTLAVVGLHGLVAYGASRRVKEIGVRMAIGADRSDVLRMVLRQGMIPSAVGLAAGLVAGLGAARVLGLVFPRGPKGDGSLDLGVFAAVALAVTAVTALAAYLPARRACRINPVDALRCE